MRKALAVLVLLTLFVAVSAETYAALNENDVVEQDGWIIKVKAIYQTQAYIGVMSPIDDEKTKFIGIGSAYLIHGVRVNVSQIGYAQDNELRAVSLIVTTQAEHECEDDSECDSGDACIIVECSGWPRKCNYNNTDEITTCIHDDGCCPGTFCGSRDNDCHTECLKNSQCNDDNSSTIDRCNLDDNLCEYTVITDCTSGDDFCPDTCIYGYASAQYLDNDCNADNECNSHSQCNDASVSTIDLCTANDTTDIKKCVYLPNPEYFAPDVEDEDEEISTNVERFAQTCTTIGEVKTIGSKTKYCAQDKTWSLLKSEGVFCEEGYECVSEICAGTCQKELTTALLQDNALLIVAIVIIGVIGVYFLAIKKVLE